MILICKKQHDLLLTILAAMDPGKGAQLQESVRRFHLFIDATSPWNLDPRKYRFDQSSKASPASSTAAASTSAAAPSRK
jgi:hypothetical protein